MGAGAIAFWPPAHYIFDPAKALGFAVPLGLWLFAEFFPEPERTPSNNPNYSKVMHPHGQAVALTLFKKADGNFVRFLKEHDFGAT